MGFGRKALYGAAMAVGLGAATGSVEQRIDTDNGNTVLENQLTDVGLLIIKETGISKDTV